MIGVFNHSSTPDADVAAWVLAVGKQLGDVAAWWQVLTPSLRLMQRSEDTPPMSIVVADEAADASAYLGIHSESSDGTIYGFVYIGAAKRTNTPASVVLSHEVLEMIMNRDVNMWCDDAHGYMYARELCDPVEDMHYYIDDVAVSNFVLPAWFDPRQRASRLDYLGELSAPFTHTRGGYMIRKAASGAYENAYGADWRFERGSERAACLCSR